jgi:hypothetical protein
MTVCCALAGKAGGAIRVCLELFGSFLFQDKKEQRINEEGNVTTKEFEKVQPINTFDYSTKDKDKVAAAERLFLFCRLFFLFNCGR